LQTWDVLKCIRGTAGFDSCKENQDLDEDKCRLNFPDFIVFDLDPYIYSGQETIGEEPEYHIKGFKATIEIAYHLKDIFKRLNIRSYIKTSGKTGLHIFVPIVSEYTYDQTRHMTHTPHMPQNSEFERVLDRQMRHIENNTSQTSGDMSQTQSQTQTQNDDDGGHSQRVSERYANVDK
jgi:LigD, primase-polymerase domain